MLSSLITILNGSWIMEPLYTLCLSLDGIVYSLVAYAFKLFMIITQLNYNSLYAIMAPLVDRVEAVIMVFILFKVGVIFLQFLVNPDQFEDKTKGGTALLINILIAIGLLGIYSFVFKLGNDISMLVIGSYDNASFQVIKKQPGEGNSGLLARFVFGTNGDIDQVKDFGKFLATSTLGIFLHDKINDSGAAVASDASDIYDKIKANNTDDFDMMEVVDLADDVDRTVDYQWPILSAAMGLFLIYSIVKIAIEAGVRIFKLIVLQIVAPIPIVSIVTDGLGGGMFKKFTDLYVATLLEVAVRIGSMYVITGFIGAFFNEMLGVGGQTQLFNTDANLPFITKGLLLVIIIVAGYTFINTLPKFLKKIFGDIISEGSGGFGKFMGGIAGGVAGLGTGLMAGITSGAGLTGTLGNMVSGAAGGVSAGAKGKNIAETFKNIQGNNTANRERAQRIARQGGGIPYLGSQIEQKLGTPRRNEEVAQRYGDANTALDNMMNTRRETLAGLKTKDGNGITFGNNEGEYVSKRIQNSARVAAADARIEALKKNPNATEDQYRDALRDKRTIVDQETASAKNEYNAALFSDSINNDKTVKNASRTYDAQAKSTGSMSSGEMQGDPTNARTNVDVAKKHNVAGQEKFTDKGSVARQRRNSTFGGKGKE